MVAVVAVVLALVLAAPWVDLGDATRARRAAQRDADGE